MKLNSDEINNLLAYAKERHGAPCRVEVCGGYKQYVFCDIYYRDFDPRDFSTPLSENDACVERILI